MLGAPPAGDAPCSVWHRRSPARATGVADRTPSRCRDACALAGGGADADEHVVAHIRGRDAQVARLRHQGATRRLYPAQPALMHDCHGRANVLLKFLRQHSPATRCATENCWPSPRSAALLQHRWCDAPARKTAARALHHSMRRLPRGSRGRRARLAVQLERAPHGPGAALGVLAQALARGEQAAVRDRGRRHARRLHLAQHLPARPRYPRRDTRSARSLPSACCSFQLPHTGAGAPRCQHA